MRRMWINQPSKLQSCHDLHGKLVLAPEKLDKFVDVYFIKGDSISGRIPSLALSKGWPKHLT